MTSKTSRYMTYVLNRVRNATDAQVDEMVLKAIEWDAVDSVVHDLRATMRHLPYPAQVGAGRLLTALEDVL